jgi:PST family polysaccharide transporter
VIPPSWKRETRAGIFWSVSTFAAGRVLTLIATIVLARVLVPAEFGVVAAILAFLSLLELGTDLGMKATVVYEQDRVDTERLHSAFTLNLLIAAALCAAGIVMAPAIAAVFGVPGEAGLFRLAVLSLLLTGLGNIQDAILLRDLAFRRRILPELTRNVVSGAVSVVLAVGGMGAASLVAGLLAGRVAWVVVLWIVTRYRPRLRIDRRIAWSMSTYGLGATVLSVIAVVATRADVVVVGTLLGPAALGIYTIAYRIPELAIRNVSWSFSRVAFPALSKMRALNRAQLADAALTLLRYQALVTVPIAAMLAVLASPVVVVLFSSAWASGGPVMSALAVVAAFDALAFPFGDALKSIRRQPTLIAINSVNIPLLIAAMIVVAPNGLVWVAWAVAVQAFVHLTMVTIITSRALGIGVGRLGRTVQPALAASAGVVVGSGVVRLAWPDPTFGPLLAGIIAGSAAGLAATAVFAPETFRQLPAIGGRALRRPKMPPRDALDEASPAPPDLAPTRAGTSS